MVTIQKIQEINAIDKDGFNNSGNSKIKIDGKEMTVDQYNNPSYKLINIIAPSSFVWYAKMDEEIIQRLKEADEFWDEFAGSLRRSDGTYLEEKKQMEELLKNKNADINLFNDIERRTGRRESLPNENSTSKLHYSQKEEKMKEVVEGNNKIVEDNLNFIKETANLILKVKEIKRDKGEIPGEKPVKTPPLDQEEAKKLEELRKQAREKINAALNQDPAVSDSELSDSNWGDLLSYSKSEERINELRDRVLADIKNKRAAKNNERPTTNQPSPIIPKTDSDRKVYNTSFQAENNETVRKFWELRGLIYDKPESWEKFAQVNFALLEKVDKAAIEAERGEFRTVWSKDSEEKKQEVNEFNKKKLTKMGEAIKLIEQLINESKKGNKNTEAKSGNKKRKAEVDIRQEVIKKNKTIANELNQLITEAAGKNTYEELELVLQKIEKYEEEEEFYYNKREEAEEIRKRLNDLDADKYKKRVIEKLEKKLKDISEELKKKLTQIKNGEVADINKINEIEAKIVEESGEKVATGTLASWIKKAENLVEGTIKQVKKDFEEVKKGLLSFSFSTKVYEQKAYEKQQRKVEEMLTKLENCSDENTNNSSLLRKEVVIPAVLITGLLVAVISIVIIRNKKRAKKLEKIED